MARVLVLSNMYPPHHYGGYELSCRDVMDRFATRGHEVTVLTTTMRVPGVAEVPGERSRGIRRDLTFYWDDHEIVTPSLTGRMKRERGNQRALAKAIDETRPEVVSAWNMGAMSLSLLTAAADRDIPVVLNICDEWPFYAPHLDAWTRLFRRRRAAGRIAELVTRLPTRLPDLERATSCFISEATRQHIVDKTGLPFRDSTVVYNGVDLRAFPISTDPPVIRPWGWRMLYVGRIDDRKGIETVIQALPKLPAEARLDVDGRGDSTYLERLHTMAAELGVTDRISFAVSAREELRERYAAADVTVFPSTWREPFGIVPLEAMACDSPVAATGTGGTGEFVIDDVNAVRFAPGDPDALVAALHRLAGDESLRRRLVLAGRATAAHLSIDRLADVLEVWHLAAANRFRDGRPSDRPPVAVS